MSIKRGIIPWQEVRFEGDDNSTVRVGSVALSSTADIFSIRKISSRILMIWLGRISFDSLPATLACLDPFDVEMQHGIVGWLVMIFLSLPVIVLLL